MVALVSKHVPIIGVIYWPIKNILYIAEKDRGAFKLQDKEWKKMNCSSVSNIAEARAVGSRNHLSEEEKDVFNSLGAAKFTPRGSSLKAMDIASGDAELYLTLTNKIKQWDTAASYCILTEAGGEIIDTSGNNINYNTKILNHEHGILMSNAKIHGLILEQLKKKE